MVSSEEVIDPKIFQLFPRSTGSILVALGDTIVGHPAGKLKETEKKLDPCCNVFEFWLHLYMICIWELVKSFRENFSSELFAKQDNPETPLSLTLYRLLDSQLWRVKCSTQLHVKV